MQLISDLALSFIYNHRHQFSKNHIFLATHAREASGDNANPQVLAEVCALVAGAKADTDIVQTTKVFHAGADPMERMGLRAQFEGNVVPFCQYLPPYSGHRLRQGDYQLGQGADHLASGFFRWVMLDKLHF